MQLTVDQLRTDLLMRYADRYGQGGLRRFLEQAVLYENARYAHAITETAVGHATLFTGALPSAHGIVGNEWFEAGRRRSSVEDARFPLLGAELPEGGASPEALRVSTLGDQLALATFGEALVYAISLKDRAAILPAGRAGKAFWYEERGGRFVTSSYYFPALPGWLEAFTARRPLERFPASWELLHPPETYRRPARDPSAAQGPERRPNFLHSLSDADPLHRSRAIKHSPYGDELTIDLVEALLAASPLGRDDIPDLLSISLSATDIIGHTFGPDSREAEDNLLRLDRTVARLFELLRARVSDPYLLVALSADHGISETPEQRAALGLPGGRHLGAVALVRQLNEELVARFGPGADFVLGFANPCLWIDEAKVEALGLDLERAERAVAELVLSGWGGYARAIVRTDLSRNTLPEGEIEQLVRASFDPQRTGHVYLVPEAGWIQANDPAALVAMHGTPYVFDRSVPIAFWGAGLEPRRVHDAADPRDIAPTLAALLSLTPPSGSSGRVLPEIVVSAAPARSAP